VAPFDPTGMDPLVLTVTGGDLSDSGKIRGTCDGTIPFEEMSNLEIAATGFASHDGAIVHLLIRTNVNGAVFGSGWASVVGGAFSLRLPRAFPQFTYPDILWFVDVDGDARCTATDHPGYYAAPAATATGNEAVALRINDNHETATSRHADVCTVMNGCQLAP
jgi:hypothetical protein